MARAPGPKNPGKYPAPVGQNYNRYGEQPGYVYNPYTDKYLPDPKVQGEYLQSQGLGEPKPPGLGETILPIAATAGALYGAQSLAPELVGSWKGEGSGLLGGIKDTLGFGSGSADAAALDAAASQAGANTALPATPGMIGASRFASGSSFYGPGGDPLTGLGAEMAPEAGFFDVGGGLLGDQPMGPGGYLPGIIGAYQAYDLFKNKKHGGKGAKQGAMAGAGIGMTVGGPVGAGIGAVVGGIGGYFGNLGDKDMWQTEAERWDKLVATGLIAPEYAERAWNNAYATRGKSKKELVAMAKEVGGNEKFAQSRDEKDLTAQDIVGYAAFAEKDPEWFNKPLDQQLQVAQQALDAGAVREHHGTIDVDWKKVNAPAAPAAPAPNQTQLETNKPLPGGPRKPVRKGRKD